MTHKFKILFLSSPDGTVASLAAGLLEGQYPGQVEVSCAGEKIDAADSGVFEVLKEAGIHVPPEICVPVTEIDSSAIDIVITLDEPAQLSWRKLALSGAGSGPVSASLLVDAPVHLHWSIGEMVDPAQGNWPVGALRRVRDALRQRIAALVADGYLTVLFAQRENMRRLLDSLGDGVIVHDDHRRILVFNREAERITGRKREDVIGRDCHEVFGPDGICGGQCAFRRQPSSIQNDREYQVKFTAHDGQGKLLRMSVAPLAEESKTPGVIASLRDISEVSELRWQLHERHRFHGMVGVSRVMQEVFETIRQVVTSDYPVVIAGESGTGKELVANAIHNESRRSGGPFVPINCGALPENILESELFGHVRGAFTGAIRDKKGRFELADGGTLFLDEVGELTPAFQVKLLRVLQEKRFERVGGEQSQSVDVRVISATNRDLRELVKEGKFREDLFYRLAVVPIKLPPLRERREDIPLLLAQIIEEIRKETGKKTLAVSDNAIDYLLGYNWPGNVRELINVLRFAAVRCDGDRILLKHLPPEVRESVPGDRSLLTSPPPPEAPHLSAPSRPRSRGILNAETVKHALAQAGGNKLKAARILGVGRATLYRFLTASPLSD